MNYYDVQISFMAGDRLVNDQILAATWAGTETKGYTETLVVTCPDGATIRYNLDKILYWQVRSHETDEERKERVSRIGYARDDDIFQTDYSKFIKEEPEDE